MSAPTCWVCGAAGSDPEPGPAGMTWRMDHADWCPVWLTLATTRTNAWPFRPGDYLSDKARSA